MSKEGMIIDIDYNITEAEAKQKKLNRAMDISTQKAENISSKIEELNSSLEEEKNKQKEIRDQISEQTEEAAKLARQLDKVKSGNASMQEIINLGSVNTAEAKLNQMVKEIKDNELAFEKSKTASAKITAEISKQHLNLKKQNAETAKIGDQIVLNGKKQNKFTQAFAKSTKSADRFGRRLKSLIASALFFSVVTKAFTALRNEFGKLITETGTKTAKLVSQLNGNLSVIGRTLYESARPAIEAVLQVFVKITNLLANVLAKVLNKNINEMKKLAEQTKKTGEEAKKATAGFDTLQTIDTSTDKSESTAQSTSKIDVDNEKLQKTKELLEQIIPLAIYLGTIFATWQITKLLTGLGLIPTSITKIIGGIALVAAGFGLLFSAAVNWDDSLHNGENTLQAILGTLGVILIVIGLIILGVAAWPVLIIGALAILGMWIDNYKDKVDKWISSLPMGIYELVDIIYIAAYGVWDFIKNLFKGLYEIFTGDWEKGLKRIGISLVNLLVDAVNIVIQGLNFLLLPIREIILRVGRLAGKNWTVKDVAIPKIPRVPQLATGAVLPGGSPMLAWVNDQPKGQTYVEGSVENIAAAFEKVLGGRDLGNQNTKLEVTGNMAQFFKYLNVQLKKENSRSTIWG